MDKSGIDFSWNDYYKEQDYIEKGSALYFVSLDTEYTQETRYKNICLSYQVSVLRAKDSEYREAFLDINNDERLTLEEILDVALELYDAPFEGSISIIVIAHNSVAEFAMLKDREAYISNMLTIRKTLTSKKTIMITNKYEVDLYDTMLIAPVGYYSLKKLSTILGNENMLKLEIKQSEIENMDRYKRNNPLGFKEYAMQDSRVTLAVWLMLQRQYNELVYDITNENGKNSFEIIQRLSAENIVKESDDIVSLNKIIDSIAMRGTSAYKVDKFYKTLGEASVRAFFTYVHSVETADVLSDEHEHMEVLAKKLNDGNIEEDEFKLKKYLKKNDVDLYSIKANKVFQKFTAKFPWNISGSKDKKFDKKFINDVYFGGRNESFYVGYTKEDPMIADDYLFIDLDFAGAYPTAMTTIPLIDWEQGVLEEVQGNVFIDRWYAQSKSIDVHSVTSIVGFVDVEFVFPSEVMYPCLPIKHDKYGLIYPLEGKTLATASEVVLAMQIIKEARSIVQQSVEYKKLAEAFVAAMNNDEKKSIQVAMERRLGYIKALRSVELIPYQSDNHPDLLLKRYFKNKIEKRNAYKALVKSSSDDNEKNLANLNDKLLKEFVNTLYGKIAQAVNPKNVFDIGTGKSVPLKYSTMTAPYVASSTTGIVRAALSALIYAIESYNRQFPDQKPIILISATTDGALFGVPTDTIIGHIDLKNINDQKFEEILPKFSASLEAYYPMKLLKEARFSVANDSYLEMKHFATEIHSIKTRGQIGFVETKNGERSTTVLAKFGHKPPLSELYEKEEYKAIMGDSVKRNDADAKWLIEQMQNLSGKIQTYPVRSLVGIKKILDPNDPTVDLVGRSAEKKMNFDYDYKRQLEPTSPYTKPFKSLRTMLKYRYAMENIRKRGLNATPELIEAKVQMNTSFSRMRGSMYDHALKIFLRALFQSEHYLGKTAKFKAQEYVVKINNFIDLHNIPA